MRMAGGEGGMEGGGTLAAGVGRVCSSGGVAEPERSRSSMGLPPPKCHVISPGPGGGGAPASASGPRASEISARKGSRPASNPDPDASPACAAAANPSTRPSADAVRASGVSRSGGGAGKRGIATADGRATLLLSVRPTEKATPPPEVDSAAASARPGSGPGSSSLRITSVGPGQSDVWFTTRCAGKREDGDGSFQKPSPWRLAISSEPSPTGTHTLDAGTNTPCFRQRPRLASQGRSLGINIWKRGSAACAVAAANTSKGEPNSLLPCGGHRLPVRRREEEARRRRRPSRRSASKRRA
mmetsp:Transcript_44463/g.145755  ORF Transcript_44463/g.145755 Transcript_44463/m.145755 type:complete len:299 (+) Transcript_44463:600-1496(+)